MVRPELEKVGERGDRAEQAHQKRVGQKENEKFVVRERDAIVDPRTVVVHLENAGIADAAVVAAVRLDYVALAAQSHGARVRSAGERQLSFFGDFEEHLVPPLVGALLDDALVVGVRQTKLQREKGRGQRSATECTAEAIRMQLTAGGATLLFVNTVWK